MWKISFDNLSCSGYSDCPVCLLSAWWTSEVTIRSKSLTSHIVLIAAVVKIFDGQPWEIDLC